MNTGTTAAREAGNMVDLDSNPTKLIEVVAIGKQLLITRGALTTFLDHERRLEVLRDYPRDVHGHVSGAWDHRITDAAPMAKALNRLEQVLNGEIAAELRANRQQSEPKPVRAVAT